MRIFPFYSGLWLCLLLLPTTLLADFDHTHLAWHKLLQAHVHWLPAGHAAQVDYRQLKQQQAELQAYLDTLSAVSTPTFAQWPRAQRLSFLINAYNAFTVALILSRYPDLQSIKDLGSWFSSPWKKQFFTLLDEKRSLDDIEHGMIRKAGAYDEPRIHFAVVCASIGCPALRNEAFIAPQLEQQLQDGQHRFLSDPSRNRYQAEYNRLQVSRIFDWYGKDFLAKSGNPSTLVDFFATQAETFTSIPAEQKKIRKKTFEIEYLPYDWKLNDTPNQGTP